MIIYAILIFFAILSWVVSARLKSKFEKYAAMPLQAEISGAEAAQMMLRDYRIHDVAITCVPGQLTDHYDSSNKTVNLSEEVFHGRNAAAVAVASHECGHAVQHATAYGMLQLRSQLVPIQNVSGTVLNIVILAGIFGGFFFQVHPYVLGMILIACYSVFSIFSLVTLPVEFDASARALQWMENSRVVTSKEHADAKDALKWAAMTYLVAALGSIATLVYYLISFFGNRD